jgi:hypothetical protein
MTTAHTKLPETSAAFERAVANVAPVVQAIRRDLVDARLRADRTDDDENGSNA